MDIGNPWKSMKINGNHMSYAITSPSCDKKGGGHKALVSKTRRCVSQGKLERKQNTAIPKLHRLDAWIPRKKND